jgi:hypothetical protein
VPVDAADVVPILLARRFRRKVCKQRLHSQFKST